MRFLRVGAFVVGALCLLACVASCGTVRSKGDGAVWTIGEAGIWIGAPGLFIGMGYSYRDATYSDESPATGLWSDS